LRTESSFLCLLRSFELLRRCTWNCQVKTRGLLSQQSSSLYCNVKALRRQSHRSVFSPIIPLATGNRWQATFDCSSKRACYTVVIISWARCLGVKWTTLYVRAWCFVCFLTLYTYHRRPCCNHDIVTSETQKIAKLTDRRWCPRAAARTKWFFHE
jgi:hypothetical protein